MQSPIDSTERAMRLGNVAAILIDLGRRARLAAESGAVAAPNEDDDEDDRQESDKP